MQNTDGATGGQLCLVVHRPEHLFTILRNWMTMTGKYRVKAWKLATWKTK